MRPPNSLYTSQALLQSCRLKETLKNTLVYGIGLTWKGNVTFSAFYLVGYEKTFLKILFGMGSPKYVDVPFKESSSPLCRGNKNEVFQGPVPSHRARLSEKGLPT